MTEDRARENIAFIRRAIDEGSAYATELYPDHACSALDQWSSVHAQHRHLRNQHAARDLGAASICCVRLAFFSACRDRPQSGHARLGGAVAIGYLGTYGFIRGWSPIASAALWAARLGLPGLFSRRRVVRGVAIGTGTERDPMAQGLAMPWLGCGVFLTTLANAVMATVEGRNGWPDAVVARVFGIGFFASVSLTRLGWLRWVAIAWWASEPALFALRHRVEAPPLTAGLMLVLLAAPGSVLWSRRSRAAA